MSEFIQYEPRLWQVNGVTIPIGARKDYDPAGYKTARKRFGGALIAASTISASLLLGAITLPSDQSWSSRLIWQAQGAAPRVKEAQVPAGYWDGLARARSMARVLSEELDDFSAPLA